MEASNLNVTWMNPKLATLEGAGQVAIPTCSGEHRYFVAETGFNERNNTVIVIIVCTQCGEGKKLQFEVAGDSKSLQLRSQK